MVFNISCKMFSVVKRIDIHTSNPFSLPNGLEHIWGISTYGRNCQLAATWMIIALNSQSDIAYFECIPWRTIENQNIEL